MQHECQSVMTWHTFEWAPENLKVLSERVSRTEITSVVWMKDQTKQEDLHPSDTMSSLELTSCALLKGKRLRYQELCPSTARHRAGKVACMLAQLPAPTLETAATLYRGPQGSHLGLSELQYGLEERAAHSPKTTSWLPPLCKVRGNT